MKKAIAIAAVAGIAGTAAAQSASINITATATEIAIGDSVTFNVSITGGPTGGAGAAFGWYLAEHFMNYVNTGSADGVNGGFNFAIDGANGIGTPLALISDTGDAGTGSAADVFAHWQVNNLNGDGVGDYILGDTYEAPVAFGSFTVQATAEGLLTYNAEADQDFIDTQSDTNALSFGAGTLGLSDTRQATAFSTNSATVVVTPTPATAALLGLGGLVAARRRR